ncbi:MAG: site-specific integrase, partial [Candidatus Omnitrophota bacterium]
MPGVSQKADLRTLQFFVAYLKVEKGLSPATVSSYLGDLVQFSGFLGGSRRRNLIDCRREDVRGFLDSLHDSGLDGRSMARKLSALRHLYRHLRLDRKVKDDPTINIDFPTRWKVLPKALAQTEVEGLLLAAGRRQSVEKKLAVAIAVRDRAMLELCYAGAL